MLTGGSELAKHRLMCMLQSFPQAPGPAYGPTAQDQPVQLQGNKRRLPRPSGEPKARVQALLRTVEMLHFLWPSA